jgi:hypothetical protein
VDKASIIYVEGDVSLNGSPASIGDGVQAVQDENNTCICSCNGAIHIEGDGGQFTQNIAASHHREVRVTRAGTSISVNAAPLLYHTDGDVEAAAAKIGETVDWTKIDR